MSETASRPRVAIAHQTIWSGDAIGNDIAGAYELLSRCGYRVALACENVHPDVRARCNVVPADDPAALARDFDLLLYHHSVAWPLGEALIEKFAGPIVVKYHNITPAEFFERYCEPYYRSCTEGRRQTERIVRTGKVARWQSDSSYNAAEVLACGVPAEASSVLSPFNHIDRYSRLVRTADYPGRPVEALFVGRRVPNKGHPHLLKTLAAWRELFPETPIRCRMVGAVDGAVQGYYDELEALQRQLDLGDCVEWIAHVTSDELDALFARSHIYLNLSEHEGFCVPLVEAQAARLPLVSTRAGAIAESAGWGQVLVDVPATSADYDLVAGLAHELCRSAELRSRVVEAGCANVRDRFTTATLETRFLEDLEPILRSIEP
jgi:glycosyltransferase involved in cell wall biosynthesis